MRFFVRLIAAVSLVSSSVFVVVLSVLESPAAAVTVNMNGSTFDFTRDADYSQIGAIAPTSVNGIARYKNVATIDGVAIDAVITTVALSNATISNYDNIGSASGNANYFQIDNTASAAGGYTSFKFDFYEGGTYTGPGSGVPVVLSNVKVTSIDLDSPGRQFTEFTGFQKYTFSTGTHLAAYTTDRNGTALTTGKVRFEQFPTGSATRSTAGVTGSNVAADRVEVSFDTMTTYTAVFGNEMAQSGYFGVIFSGLCASMTPATCTAVAPVVNPSNQPPTSSNVTLNVGNGSVTTLAKANFGTYADPDSNPFAKVKITTLPTGSLQFFDGSAWSTVGLNQEILVSDIELNKLRFTGTVNDLIGFKVYDGLVYSTNAYTLTLTMTTSTQTISFSNPGAKAASITFASGATASSGLTVTLTSSTPGICTINGSNALSIDTVANGTCIIVATQTGNGSYAAAASVTQIFSVSSLTSQTITFANPGPKTYAGSVLNIASGATASSSLVVTLTSYTPTVCTIDGSVGLQIDVISSGSCQIRATQAGNGTYAPASPVEWIFLVSPSLVASAPRVNTLASSDIDVTTATLNGSVNANGASTTVTMCWSTSISITNTLPGCTSVNPTPATVTGNSATDVSFSLTGLTASTTYYYQVSAVNSAGSTDGNIYGFNTMSATASAVVTVTTDPAASISDTGATLNGTANPASGILVTQFCWGTDVSMATCTTVAAAESPISGSSDVTVSKVLTGLSSGTTYYYYSVVDNDGTLIIGDVETFTTTTPPSAPTATTTAATSITQTTVTLNGSVTANFASTAITFCWGTVASTLGCTSVSATPGTASGGTATAASYSLGGLSAGAVYYFRIKGSSAQGTTLGSILSFTTLSATTTTVAPTTTVAGVATTTTTVAPTTTVAGVATTTTTTTTTTLPGRVSAANVVSDVTGVIWKDLNKNGKQDANEPGIPNVVVRLSSSTLSNVSEEAITDSQGVYKFSVTTAGEYTVTATVPKGQALTASTDSDGNTDWKVNLTVASATRSTANFAATGGVRVLPQTGQPIHQMVVLALWLMLIGTIPVTAVASRRRRTALK